VYPCDRPRQLIANVNFLARRTVSNAVVVPVSASGTVCFYSSVAADVVVDINGWFSTTSSYRSVTPGRVFDTRPGESPNAMVNVLRAKVGPAAPSSGTGVLAFGVHNDTALRYSGSWTVGANPTLYQGNDHYSNSPGATASFDFNGTGFRLYAAKDFPHGVMAVSVDGGPDVDVDLYSRPRQDAMVYERADLPAGPHTVVLKHTGRKNPLSQDAFVLIDRVDILSGSTPLPPPSPGRDAPLEVTMSDLPNIPQNAGVLAVSLNVAVTNPDAAGFVTVYPCGTRPFTASVNFRAGQTVSNAVITPVSPTGTVCFYSLVPTDIVVDINGYFTT
jgi:hypothetical protein